jgi:outer membrane protein
MKKISPVLNIVLLIAVAILYVLHFWGESKEVETKAEKVALPTELPVDGSVVYVDMEKLLLQYQYSVELNQEFLMEKERLENEMKVEYEKYEKEANKYQEKVARGGFISAASAENQKAELLIKQQQLQQLQVRLENDWFKKEEELESLLYDAIIGYLEEISQLNNYHYVLSKVIGGSVLVGKNNLNITDIAIDELNKRYEQVKTEDGN